MARVISKAFALAVITVLSLATPGAAAQGRGYVLATATAGGTFYPVGVALATLVKVKLQPTHKMDMTAINTAGSSENVRLLMENKAQFALLDALMGHAVYTWMAPGPFAAEGPQTHLRSVASLWHNVEHFMVKRQYASTGTIEDVKNLQGKKVSLGRRASGALRSSRFFLGNLGIDIDREMDLVYLGYDASVQALQRGQIEAMNAPDGVPVPAVARAKAALGDDLVILEFTDAQLAKADGGLGLWSRYVIPAGTYPSQAEDINTIAAATFLAVRDDVDEDDVYRITKTIYENLAFLRIIHRALLDISLDRAMVGLPIPLHPGALRYYREIGLDIPDRLIPEWGVYLPSAGGDATNRSVPLPAARASRPGD